MKTNKTLKELTEDVQKGLYFAYTFVLLKKNGAFVKNPMANGTVRERISCLKQELGERHPEEELNPADFWKIVLGLFLAFSIPSVILTYCCFEVFPFKSEFVRIFVVFLCLTPCFASIAFLVTTIFKFSKIKKTKEFVISLLAGLSIMPMMIYLFIRSVCLVIDFL